MTKHQHSEENLQRNAANYTPLTPMSLIARAAYVYPEHLAVVHGTRRYTWGESTRTRAGWPRRCRSRASAPAIRSR